MGIEEMRRRFSQDENLYPRRVLSDTDSNIAIDSRYGRPKLWPVGAHWETRQQCSAAGVHKPTMAGISGCNGGAFSVVLSGGYEDGEDDGETFLYIGTGGKRDASFGAPGPQVEDQSMEHPHNKYLFKSFETGGHVRVVRGPNPASPYAPLYGYRYDGLYTVTHAWEDKGVSGYKVCKFRFERTPGQSPLPLLVARPVLGKRK
ncbi:PUA-like domain-containing protein [Mycena haematopus]|nr:PUA-like domain-containing protein [Mycena haematopus]